MLKMLWDQDKVERAAGRFRISNRLGVTGAPRAGIATKSHKKRRKEETYDPDLANRQLIAGFVGGTHEFFVPFRGFSWR
ncbi:MAG: hypothetical protein CMJ18_14350 [Phycisphaeraceae bacterium]|nr:hypothetical protein [Phycisphaeraceae bacterium]